MNMPFVKSFEWSEYKTKLRELVTYPCEERSTSQDPEVLLHWDSDNLSRKGINSNCAYWAKDIGFQLRLCRHHGQHRMFFIRCHDVELFSLPP